MNKSEKYNNYIALTLNEIIALAGNDKLIVNKILSKISNTVAGENLVNYFNQKAINDKNDYYSCGMNIYRT